MITLHGSEVEVHQPSLGLDGNLHYVESETTQLLQVGIYMQYDQVRR